MIQLSRFSEQLADALLPGVQSNPPQWIAPHPQPLGRNHDLIYIHPPYRPGCRQLPSSTALICLTD
jgi:hypothetical protein